MKKFNLVVPLSLAVMISSSAFANTVDLSGAYQCSISYDKNQTKETGDMVVSVKDGKYLTEYHHKQKTNIGTSNSLLGQPFYVEQWASEKHTGVTYWKQNGDNLEGTTISLTNDKGEIESDTQTCQKK